MLDQSDVVSSIGHVTTIAELAHMMTPDVNNIFIFFIDT